MNRIEELEKEIALIKEVLELRKQLGEGPVRNELTINVPAEQKIPKYIFDAIRDRNTTVGLDGPTSFSSVVYQTKGVI